MLLFNQELSSLNSARDLFAHSSMICEICHVAISRLAQNIALGQQQQRHATKANEPALSEM
jgi:hypothetical protein